MAPAASSSTLAQLACVRGLGVECGEATGAAPLLLHSPPPTAPSSLAPGGLWSHLLSGTPSVLLAPLLPRPYPPTPSHPAPSLPDARPQAATSRPVCAFIPFTSRVPSLCLCSDALRARASADTHSIQVPQTSTHTPGCPVTPRPTAVTRVGRGSSRTTCCRGRPAGPLAPHSCVSGPSELGPANHTATSGDAQARESPATSAASRQASA